MSDAKFEMKIPEQFISDTIRAEIVRQIPNKEEFAATVIRHALTAEAKDQYGYRDPKRTVFQAALDEMIREEAKRVFADWLTEHRALIREAILKELTATKAKRLKKLAEQIVDGLADFRTSVSLSISGNGNE